MGKLKVKKGAVKRFKTTKGGKILKRGGFSSHLKQKKSKSRTRRQKVPTDLATGDKKRIRKLI
ncbi:50S ribosomal protein L35 [Patescibacteria group bacterium]|nr:50S ribosomal protein L35 [Patescibacteria group bacterium]